MVARREDQRVRQLREDKKHRVGRKIKAEKLAIKEKRLKFIHRCPNSL